jgi:HlyD family secretion protein
MQASTPRAALPAALDTDFRRVGQIGGRAALGAFAVFMLLMIFIPISGAIIGAGVIEVDGDLAPVESIDGGRVGEILVADGDEVDAGEPLVVLIAPAVTAELGVLNNRLLEVTVQERRLRAEIEGGDVSLDGIDPAFSDTDIRRVATEQQAMLDVRRDVHESGLSRLSEIRAQLEAQKAGIAGQAAALRERADLAAKDLATVEGLVEQQLVTQSRLLDAQSLAADLQGSIIQQNSEEERLLRSIAELEFQISESKTEFRERAVTELRETTLKRDELILQVAEAQERLERHILRAPSAGYVHDLKVTSVGAIVPPGEPVALIVPIGGTPKVVARVSPKDVDDIEPGQAARLVFPTFNARTTPQINGTVDRVSATSFTDPATGQAYFKVEIAVTADEIARLGVVRLMPGMPVEARVTTGERSVMSYLLRPVVDQFGHAFREK